MKGVCDLGKSEEEGADVGVVDRLSERQVAQDRQQRRGGGGR
jgi:hypothetical protein